MSINKKCKECGLEDQEYYPNRRICKKCVIAQSKKTYEQTYAVSVSSIKCKKCEQTKHGMLFPISQKTNLRKEICNECRKPPTLAYIDEPRFIELKMRWYALTLSSSVDDMNRLKYIILNT